MMFRRILVLAITGLQVVVFGSLIVWRVAEWNAVGWVGMSYNVDTEVEREWPQPAFFWGADSRRVEMIAPGGPADRAGISVGDTIVSVNGVEVADIDGLRGVADRARTGAELNYRLDGAEGRRDIGVTLEAPYRNPLVIAGTATTVVAGAVFLLISMLVYWSRPRSQVALVFFLMCVFGAAEYLIWALIEFDFPNMRGITPTVVEPLMFAGMALVGFFAVALVNTLLHLSLIFPRARPVVSSWPQVFGWIHLLPFMAVFLVSSMIAVGLASRTVVGTVLSSIVIGAGACLTALRFRRFAVESGWLRAIRAHPLSFFVAVLLTGGSLGLAIRMIPQPTKAIVVGISFSASFFLCLLFILVYSVITVIALYRSYRESGVDEQRQVRWPLWGTLTAVGSSIVLMIGSLILSLFFGNIGHIDFTTNIGMSAASKMVYLLIPISLAFGIVKYRLMEIDVIIRKTVVYTLVTGFVLVVYLVLAGLSGLALVRSAGVESQAATVMATLLVVALFVPVKNLVQRFVDRSFFHRERDTEDSIARITETVGEAISLEAMTLEVAEEVQKVLRCRSVAVLVKRAGSDRFSAEATVGLPDRAVSGLWLPASSPVFSSSSLSFVSGRSDLTPDESGAMQRAAADRGVICRRGDEALGLIAVGRKLSKEPYDEGDEVFLEGVAGQLAVGLGRLRGRRAEIEFAQALQIQRSLLPAEIPQIEGVEVTARWQPAREVSGDYYDVLQLGPDRLALCIGDVVGKGMPAALLMSNLQAAVKAVATFDADPASVCAQVRSVVTSNLQGGKFVTFFFAVIDSATRKLRYSNCGHNPPALVRADGSTHRLSEGGPAFARLMGGLGFSTGEIDLESGDRIVLFTDGVSEAMNGAAEQFGEDRLERLIVARRDETAIELEATVFKAVFDHADGELQDDLTLVVAAVN